MKISQICCIGAGFVGGPTMAVIAHECPNLKIVVVDNNQEKLNYGIVKHSRIYQSLSQDYQKL